MGIQFVRAEEVVIIGLYLEFSKLRCILLVIYRDNQDLLLPICVLELARFVFFHPTLYLLGQSLSKLCCILALTLGGVDLTSSYGRYEQIFVDLLNLLFELVRDLGAVDGL
jgi:hypothetical protein